MKKYLIIISIVVVILILISIFLVDILKVAQNRNKYLKIDNIKSNPKNVKIGLITGFGGLGDKSFNDMQYNGLLLAKKIYNIEFQYFSPQNFDDISKYTQVLIDNNCTAIIIGEGYIGHKVLDRFAEKYPNIKFVILDAICQKLYPNTASILFKQNEVSFLVGYLAAEKSKNKSVGFIGGADIDVINDFYSGFEQGVKYANTNCKIEKEYISSILNDFEKVWDSPDIANKIALKLILKKRVDVIFAVAAASNIGIFNACKQNSVFSIGVDTDQDYLIPGTILTSALKNLDQAIVFIIEKIIDNKFESKTYYLGLKENGVGLSPMIYTRNFIGEDVIKKIYTLQKKIVDGELTINTIFEK